MNVRYKVVRCIRSIGSRSVSSSLTHIPLQLWPRLAQQLTRSAEHGLQLFKVEITDAQGKVSKATGLISTINIDTVPVLSESQAYIFSCALSHFQVDELTERDVINTSSSQAYKVP